MNGLVVKLMRL